MLAVIGGSGFYKWNLLDGAEERIVATAYGDATVFYGSVNGENFCFLPRHGSGHSIPPHLINYRANLMALHSLGVTQILALNAVGSLDTSIAPGELVLMDDFLDFTWGREQTFFTGGEAGVKHVNMSEPYCREWQKQVLAAAVKAGVAVRTGGVYACMQGPRFETPAEVRMLQKLGGTVAGMTAVPEICLAKELGICYNGLSIITNYGCGLAEPLRSGEVIEVMEQCFLKIESLLNCLAQLYKSERTCQCLCENQFI